MPPNKKINSHNKKLETISTKTTPKYQSTSTKKDKPNGCVPSCSWLNNRHKLQASDSFQTTRQNEPIDTDREAQALPIQDHKSTVWTRLWATKSPNSSKVSESTALFCKTPQTSALHTSTNSICNGSRISNQSYDCSFDYNYFEKILLYNIISNYFLFCVSIS